MNAIERLIEKYMEDYNDMINKEAMESWSVSKYRPGFEITFTWSGHF